MKKLITVVLYLALSVILLSLNVMEVFADIYSGGPVTGDYDGSNAITSSGMITTSGTYYIDSESGLTALSDYVNVGNDATGYTFIQTADIDLTSGFTPIGNYTNEKMFNGTYIGTGYSILNLEITSTDTGGYNGVGLFGYVRYNGKIIDVTIENVSINVNSLTKVGALVGYSRDGATITGSTITGDIEITGSDEVGGLVGYNRDEASIIESTIQGDITINGFYNVGGLVGLNELATITDSTILPTSIPTITGIDYVGGFVGFNLGGTISGSYISSEFDLQIDGDDCVGGFVGYNGDYEEGITTLSLIETSYIDTTSTLKIVGSNFVGGFVGFNGDYNTTNYTAPARIQDSFITTKGITITATSTLMGNIGGFAGGNWKTGDLLNDSLTVSSNLIITSPGQRVAGFIGINDNGDIDNSYLIADFIDISTSNTYVGGFIGENLNNGNIINSYLSSNDISLESTTSYGVAGFVAKNSSNSNISNVYINTPSLDLVGTGGQLGLLFGYNGGQVSDSFALVQSLTGSTSKGQQSLDFNQGTVENIYYNFETDWKMASAVTTSYTSMDEIGYSDVDFPESTLELIEQVFDSATSDFTDSGMNTLIELDASTYDSSRLYAPLITNNESTPSLLPNQTLFDVSWMLPEVVTPTTHSEIHSLALEETHHVELEFNELTIEVGAEVLYPTYEGYELYGYYKVDLTNDVEITGTVDTGTVGDYEITYTLNEYNDHTLVTDEDIEVLTVHVVDTTPPVITGSEEVRLVLDSNDYPEITCIDTYSTCTLTQDMELDSSTLGTKVITYTGVDESGNETIIVQTVTVEVPVVETKVISVGTQDFVFPLSERDYDLENITVKVLVSEEVPTADDANWMIYAEQELTTKENELVYLMVSDGTNYVIKSTVPKQVTEVVEPEPDTPSTDTTDSISAVVVVDESGMNLWWLWIILVVAVIVVGRRYIVSKKL